MSRIPRFNPPNVVKTKHDEELWQRATKSAEQQGQAGNYRYIMGTFMRMKEHRGGETGDYFLAPGETLYAKQRRPRARANPEWAKSLGRGMYRAGDYAVRSARDVVRGIREAHATRRNPEVDDFVVARALSFLEDPNLDPDTAVNLCNRTLAGEDIAAALAGTGLLIDITDAPPTQVAQVELSSGGVVDVPVTSFDKFQLVQKLDALESASTFEQALLVVKSCTKQQLSQLAITLNVPEKPKTTLAKRIAAYVFFGEGAEYA